jgi:hypothetical protein
MPTTHEAIFEIWDRSTDERRLVQRVAASRKEVEQQYAHFRQQLLNAGYTEQGSGRMLVKFWVDCTLCNDNQTLELIMTDKP